MDLRRRKLRHHIRTSLFSIEILEFKALLWFDNFELLSSICMAIILLSFRLRLTIVGHVAVLCALKMAWLNVWTAVALTSWVLKNTQSIWVDYLHIRNVLIMVDYEIACFIVGLQNRLPEPTLLPTLFTLSLWTAGLRSTIFDRACLMYLSDA